ncbi:ABC transporter permease [Candidatus Babeliales bacterium]|nr:ABC transporter permease [Candidatus Babeliales bacterium]
MKERIKTWYDRVSDETAFFLASPAVIWQVLFLYVPILFVVSASFFRVWGSFHLYDVTLEHFRAVFTSEHIKVIIASLAISLGTALTCLVIAYPVAYTLVLKTQKYRTIFFALISLPFWTNFLVLAYSWFFVLGTTGVVNRILIYFHIISEPIAFLNSPLAVGIVMIYCYLPFMIMPLYTSMERLDIRLLEASRDLGATPRKTFFDVTLPLTMSGIRNGFLLVLVPAFGEYAIPALFGGGKKLYVGTLIAEYFLSPRSAPQGAAFTIMGSCALLAAIVFSSRLFRMSHDEEEE